MDQIDNRFYREIDEHRQLMSLAAAHADFVERYASMIPDDRRRDDFRRELQYLIHLTYREAQVPLTKQLTQFLMTHISSLRVGL